MMFEKIWITTTLFMLASHMGTIEQSNNNYEVMEISNTLHFDEILGEAVMTTDTWTVVTNMTIINHADITYFLSETLREVERLCRPMDGSGSVMPSRSFVHNCLATTTAVSDTYNFVEYLRKKISGMLGKIRMNRSLVKPEPKFFFAAVGSKGTTEGAEWAQVMVNCTDTPLSNQNISRI